MPRPSSPETSIDTPTGNPILDEARSRFRRVSEWEATARDNFIADYKFAHGDSYNGFQWPDNVRSARDQDNRPCLTINQVRQHNLQVVNDIKQNKLAVKMRPTGNGATVESALCAQDLVRRIEYKSRASNSYMNAVDYTVNGGIGWWRISTDYDGPDTFNQEIMIDPVIDPLSVYMDPDIKEKDGLDAKWAFVFSDIPKEEWRLMYPKYVGGASLNPLGLGGSEDNLTQGDYIKVCEYFRLVDKEDKLVEFRHEGKRKTMRASRLPKEVLDAVLEDPLTRFRKITDKVVEWKLIAGMEIVDEMDWIGKYIPLIRVVGEETTIEGVLDRKGHTRAMLDAQRMYNYNSSSQVEHVALQGKTPWLAASKAIEEYESMWNTANTANHSVMIWNSVDDENPDVPIPPPIRIEPANVSMAYQAGMETAATQMMMSSGQWQNQMGMGGAERTGQAIGKRQHQSDTAVFHFQDNFAIALRATGIQILDLIPKIYDSRRVVMAMGADGVDREVEIDPTSRQAYLEERGRDEQIARRVLNPQIGSYDVEADAGASYGTKREETAQALTLILTQAPQLTPIVGDLLLASLDFDKADEAAQRLKRMVPAQALGKGPSAMEQELQKQVQQLSAVVAKNLDLLAKEKLKLVGKGEMRDIDTYKAETDRMKALGDMLGLDESGVRSVLEQLVDDATNTKLQPVLDANKGELGGTSDSDSGSASSPTQPALPGARKAPDGQWYLPDPQRSGKYLRIGGGANAG